MMLHLQNKLDNLCAHHEAMLHQHVFNANIKAPVLQKATEYVLFPGGKRIRPLLVYLCGELLQVPRPCLDAIACAIECMHTYSLVHDDLPAMDNDDIRRGKPSCHRAFDEATAILVGDGLQALAIDILLIQLPHILPYEKILRMIKELIDATGFSGMVSGQSLDLSELSQPNTPESSLRTIQSLKTGRLMVACTKMVIAACTHMPHMASILSDYAAQLGLAFQMQDDYLDKYAPTTILGKSQSSDEKNQKITFTHWYTESELQQKIHDCFEEAKMLLTPFKDKAACLTAFTDWVQQRQEEPS